MDTITSLWYQNTNVFVETSTSLLKQHTSLLAPISTTITDKKHIVLSTLSVVFGSFILWRATIRQKQQHGSKVKLVSGGLPFFGHVFESSHDSIAFVKRCKAERGPAFRMKLLGQELYVVTGQLIPEIFQNTELYDFHEPYSKLIPIHWMQELCYGHKFKGEHIGKNDKQPVIHTLQHNFDAHQIRGFSKRIQQGTRIAIEEHIDIKPGEKKTFPVSDVMPFMISQILSYCLAGHKAGTNPEFTNALVSYTRKVCQSGFIHILFPSWISMPIIKRFYSVEQELDLLMDALVPELEQALDSKQKKYQSSLSTSDITTDDKNDNESEEADFLSMLLFGLPKANGEMRTPKEAAFHYPGMALAGIISVAPFVLFILHELAYLSTSSTFIDDLRGELGKLVEWTPESIGQNKLLDSFMREILRFKVSAITSPHRTTADAILSNGETIPSGSIVITAPFDAHTDPDNNTTTTLFHGDKTLPIDQFDPYRFIYISDESKTSTTIGSDYLTFGVLGRACPARFFAVNMLKYIVAELIMQFNITPVVMSSKRPKDSEYFGTLRLAPTAPVILEKRKN
ncbi:cytochrome P450 [Phascolomyces articulosus]|uniref:Cytochrome P450 n=1 Tax=Phascolomyces articulosus TaxID=60185 RepID=A0AAD5PAU5_9FUNG|nr:cytochrome P450 [Phascolomyces articulosus]